MAGADVIGVQPTDAERTGSERRGRDWWQTSGWLVAVALGFLAAELIFVANKPGLGWDEVVYITQINSHAAAAPFGAPRARGITLLIAPVTYFTTSVLVLRLYLSVLSALALLGAMWVWRRLVPRWIVAGAGLFFGSLWLVQYYGPRAMPEMWVALSALSAVGFFLRSVGCAQIASAARLLGKPDLAGLAGALTVCALMRPGDAVCVSVPMIAAVLAVRAWRHWQVVMAVLAGLFAGGLEWVIEAYLRFHGLVSRLHAAAAQQSGFGLHAGIWDELRSLNGPVICRAHCIPELGYQQPWLTLWWLALPALTVLGVLAARRAGRLGPALLAAACAFGAGFQYLFLINYAAPRFLIPMYALVAIPVAECVAWLLARRRLVSTVLVAVGAAMCIVLQVVSQHVVLSRIVAASRTEDARAGRDLRALGFKAPCLIKGQLFVPFAYYAGCASATLAKDAAPGVRVGVIEAQDHNAPSYAAGWPARLLPGTAYVVFIKPKS
jgi:hypothetical protein